MKVFRGLPHAASRAPCALTIGNFDGVHRGHQALLLQVRQAATELGIEAAVMTFEPHPREFFAQLSNDPLNLPTRVANLRDKLQSLSRAGIDRVIVEHFNTHFSSLLPQEFIEKIVVQGLHVKWLMVGKDFCFGAQRAGNVATLIEAGKQYGFQVHILSDVIHEGVRVSSSAVRAALAAGDFDQTHRLLGHAYAISGHVVHGQKLGRSLGFPTLNLRILHKRPALSGIFIVQVHGLSNQPLPAVASIGTRPTLDDSGHVLLEVFILKYAANCYGKLVRIEFLQKLRDEEKFTDIPTLKAAIACDVEQAQAYFDQRVIAAVSVTDRI